jgi:hypothetical protein
MRVAMSCSLPARLSLASVVVILIAALVIRTTTAPFSRPGLRTSASPRVETGRRTPPEHVTLHAPSSRI